jgi:ribonuclease HII
MPQKDSYVIGVDEAGLGPILGPLVVAGVRVNARHVSILQRLGVRDSKLFSSYKQSRLKRKLVWRRARLFLQNFQMRTISANEIDVAYLRGITMYDLEVRAVAEILDKLKWQTAKTIYLHQLGQTRKNKFFQKLHEHDIRFFSKSFSSKVVYEMYADKKYIPVSAASILAKVTRDALVDRICQKAGEEYVSGYSNNNTVKFLRRYLERHHALPLATRRTRNWKPLRELISEEQTINSF